MLNETFSVILKHRELVHKQVREKDESNLIDYGLERPLKKRTEAAAGPNVIYQNLSFHETLKTQMQKST